MIDFEKKGNETNDSFAAKEQQTPSLKGVYVHKFAKPFNYADKTVTEMEFRFEDLTGRDMLGIEREMQDMQEYALAPEISSNFQCKLAAKAAGVGSDMLESLPLKDFNRITNAARNFLIGTGY